MKYSIAKRYISRRYLFHYSSSFRVKDPHNSETETVFYIFSSSLYSVKCE